MGAGLVLSAVGYLVLLTQISGDAPLAVLVATTVVFSLGEAPVFMLTNDLIIGAAPPERAGAAAAISETGSELGGALGIAILGSIGIALYRGQVDDGIPEGVPPEQATAARDTLGGAVAAGDELPAPLADELLAAARDAFTLGMQVTALTSAVIAAATAVLVVVFLRHVRSGPEEAWPREVEPAIPPVPAAELE